MMRTNISVNSASPVYTLKTKKNNQQTSFKGNAVAETHRQGMTQEQKTWLAIGLTTLGALAIGLIVWACSKGKKTSETITPQITSQTVDKATVKIKEQFKELDDKMQKHFINVSSERYNPRWDMVKVVPNVAAPFESQNEFQLYEMKILVPQLLGRRYQLLNNGKNISKSDEKETFVEYLKLRSEYFDKDNEFDVVRSEMLKNPSDDVVDAEILRLSMLASNTRQFLYSDESVEEPHRMVNFVRPLLNAKFTAKMLEEFKPKKAQKDMTENEKKYFEYMNKLGKFWHERLKTEASEKLPNFAKIITGKVEAPKCYTKGLEERHDKRNIFLLDIPIYESGIPLCNDVKNPFVMDKFTDILSDETKAKLDEFINKKVGIGTLASMITYLEDCFILLKIRVDYCTYNWYEELEKKVNQLISEVLI